LDHMFGLFSIAGMNADRKVLLLNTIHILSFLGNIDELEYFLDTGADVNAKTPDVEPQNGLCFSSMTALVAATWRGNDKAMELLLRFGADANEHIRYAPYDLTYALQPCTALGFAVERSWHAGIQLLLGHGAKIDRWT